MSDSLAIIGRDVEEGAMRYERGIVENGKWRPA
jgi:hypothetical protein